MYGIFSSIYCLSNVSAGLITTFALGFFDSQTYFLIITALGVLSILFCIFFVKNLSEKKEIIENNSESLLSQSEKEQLSQQEKSQKEQLSQQEQTERDIPPLKYDACKSIKETFKFIPVMFPVIMILIIDGLSLGVYSSQIAHLIPEDT